MKTKKCGCDDYSQTVKDVIEVLEREVSLYSTENTPERITRIRSYIEKLNKSCSP